MAIYEDGTMIKTRRNGAGFMVEHFNTEGVVINNIECDTLAEMAAAVHYGPSRW